MPDPDGLMGPQLAPVIRYEYDDIGRRTKVIDPLWNSTQTTYNSRGQVTSITDAAGNVTSAAYDASGNVVSTTDALGNDTTYAVDALDRVTSVTQPHPHADLLIAVTYGTERVNDEVRPTGDGHE